MRYSVIVALLLIGQILTGCKSGIPVFREKIGYEDSILDPVPPYMTGSPKGNDSYSIGWRDGCHTYASVVGTGVLRLKSHRIDGHKLTSDTQYKRGFMDAALHCTLYIDWDTH